MIIYIEYVILDNMTINFILLMLTAMCSRCPFKKSRLILAAMIGTAVAIVLPLVYLPIAFELLVKIILSFVMVLTINQNPRRFFLQLFLFYVLTFAMGGAIIGIFYLFNTPVSSLSIITYSNDIPIGLIALVPLLSIFAIKKFLRYLDKKKGKFQNIMVCTVVFGKKTFNINAFFDSGNNLCTPDGQAVCILSQCLFHKLTNIETFGSINIITVTGSQNAQLYKLDGLILADKQFENVQCALVSTQLFSGGAELLLHTTMRE